MGNNLIYTVAEHARESILQLFSTRPKDVKQLSSILLPPAATTAEILPCFPSIKIYQILTSRQTTFSIMKTNNKKVGLNVLANQLSILEEENP